MKLLNSVVRRSNLGIIKDKVPVSPTMEYLDELTRQQDFEVSRIYSAIQLLGNIHMRQSLDSSMMDLVRRTFPKHVSFFNTLPVTVTATRSGLTELTTYLHAVITDETTKLLKWIINNYSSVLPVSIEESTPTVDSIIEVLTLVNANIPAVSGQITADQLTQLKVLMPFAQASAPLEKVAYHLSSVTNGDARSELKFTFKMAKQQSQLALTGHYSSIAGLETRLNIVKDVLSKLTTARVIPLWGQILA